MMQNDSADEMRAKLAALLTDLGLQGEEAERLMPLLYHVLGLGDHATLQHVEPEQLRRQILYAVRTIIERRLALSPLLIVVEDLHWADAVSLEALRFVMDRLERTRLMLLVTHRPAPENDQLDSSRVSHTALRLSPLNSADGRSLLAALFGESWVNSAGGLLEQILDRAGATPFLSRRSCAPYRSRCIEARGPAMADSLQAKPRPAFPPPSRQCCSPASTGCHRRCAGWPRKLR